MLFSLEKVSELTGKSIKTIYRHMSQGGLKYSVDDMGNRKISLDELQSFYKITVKQEIDDSQMRFSHENSIENKLDVLIELTKLQVEATTRNNELLEKMNSQMILTAPVKVEPKQEPEQVIAPEQVTNTATSGSNYLDDIPVFTSKK
jgi:hypothetical protein